MSTQQESPGVAVARAHVEAWSSHEFDAAREALAPDVHVTATTVDPGMPVTDLTGIEDYMRGLKEFAHGVVPGTARVLASLGDERHALLLVTVRAKFGPDAPAISLPGARLYLLDEDNKIKAEQVIFCALQD
jgi:hypothetical protein